MKNAGQAPSGSAGAGRCAADAATKVAQTFQSAVSPISNRQGIGKPNALVNS
jgi:hypothetical protein